MTDSDVTHVATSSAHSLTATDAAPCGAASASAADTVTNNCARLSTENVGDNTTTAAAAVASDSPPASASDHPPASAADDGSDVGCDQLDNITNAATTTTTSSSSSSSTAAATNTDDTAADISNRIWIGNLDLRVSEFRLLQALRSCGTVTGFDFPLHRSGPQAGRPRGFAFASFANRMAALRALLRLDGRRIGDRYLRTRWALQSERAPAGALSSAPLPAPLPVPAKTERDGQEEQRQQRTGGEAECESGAPADDGDAPRPVLISLSSTEAKIRAIEMALARSAAEDARARATAAEAATQFACGRRTSAAQSSVAAPEHLPRIKPVVAYINAANKPLGATSRPTRRTRDRYRPAPRRPYRRR